MSYAAVEHKLTITEYLQGELRADVRHEYVNGEVYAMVGTSKVHNLISLSIATALRSHLQGGPCQVFMADVKVYVKSQDDARFYYPDVLVACDPADQEVYYTERPALIVEVLSESTERNDRADKFYAYRRLDALQEYVLVAQDVQRVEVYRRETGWDLEIYRQNDHFQLATVDQTLNISEIYDAVVIPAGDKAKTILRKEV